jgi:hypothetical protein
VNHLIPLEPGGSNDIKKLWPQLADPRPGDTKRLSPLRGAWSRQLSAADAKRFSKSRQDFIMDRWSLISVFSFELVAI